MFIDLLIIIFLLLGALIGMKRGFTKQLVTLVGFIAVLVISFLLKGYIANLFYDICPFFKFDGLTSLNILLYEALSMLILIAFLSALWRLLLMLTSAFEKFLNFTIILGIPSKILGAILGIVEHIAITFIVLYVASVNFNFSETSKLSEVILTKTPLLSSVCDDTIELFDDINDLRKKSEDVKNSELNLEIIKLIIEKDVVSEEKITELINNGKLKI